MNISRARLQCVHCMCKSNSVLLDPSVCVTTSVTDHMDKKLQAMQQDCAHIQHTCHITTLAFKSASNLRINSIVGLLVMNSLDFQLVEGPPLSIKFQTFVVQQAHSVLESPVLLDPGTQRLQHVLFQVIGLQRALIYESRRSVGSLQALVYLA